MSAHLPAGAEDLTKAPALAEDLSKAIAGRSPNMQEPQEEFFFSILWDLGSSTYLGVLWLSWLRRPRYT